MELSVGLHVKYNGQRDSGIPECDLQDRGFSSEIGKEVGWVELL